MYASSPAAARMAATIAIENLDTLLLAAEARHCQGSWIPGSANNVRDFDALAAPDNILAAHRRRWA